jgi:hypothetical protein
VPCSGTIQELATQVTSPIGRTWTTGYFSGKNRISEEWRLFGSCRGKHTFFDLVLARPKAIHEKRLMGDMAEKQGELICAFLMRQISFGSPASPEEP